MCCERLNSCRKNSFIAWEIKSCWHRDRKQLKQLWMPVFFCQRFMCPIWWHRNNAKGKWSLSVTSMSVALEWWKFLSHSFLVRAKILNILSELSQRLMPKCFRKSLDDQKSPLFVLAVKYLVFTVACLIFTLNEIPQSF